MHCCRDSFLLGLVIAVLVAMPIGGQELDLPREPGVMVYKYIEKYMASSTLQDLTEWAASLGLSTSGDREAIETTLKSYYLSRMSPDTKEKLTQPVATPAGTEDVAKKASKIVIRKADRATYFKLELIGDTLVRLSGGASISVEDNEKQTVHEIQADTITVNQDTEVLHASGAVIYKKTGTNQKEEFSGTELYFNGKTYETWLFNGSSKVFQNAPESSSSQSYKSDSSYRSADEVSVLRNMKLSSSVWDPPAYHIRAATMYLLQPGEWFLEDAVLYVGNVPVFYVPFFYNPSDSLVFHPTTGYLEKEGNYIQTTTYLLGKKGEDAAFLDLLQISLPDNEGESNEELRGLFLRKTKKKVVAEDWGTGKILADIYTRLGTYAAFHYEYKGKGSIQQLQSKIGIAATRNIYTGKGGYSTYLVNSGTGTEYWQSSNFSGLAIPFRYYIDLATDINSEKISIKLGFPLYSDPKVASDYGKRSEDIEWGKILGIKDDLAQTTAASSSDSSLDKTRLDWLLTVSMLGPLATLPPFIENFSLQRFENHVIWKTVNPTDVASYNTAAVNNNSASMFVPESLTLPAAGLAISGTILNLPGTQSNAAITDGKAITFEPPVDTSLITVPDTTDTKPDSSPEKPQAEPFMAPVFPGKVGIENAAASVAAPFSVKIGYDVSPTTELKGIFADNIGKKTNDMQYDAKYWSILLNSTQRLTGTFSAINSILTLQESLAWSEYSLRAFGFYKDLTKGERDAIIVGTGTSNSSRISQTSRFGVQPFKDGLLSGSTLAYEFNNTLYERVFSVLNDAGELEFRDRLGYWNETDVSVHRVFAELRTEVKPFSQTVTLESSLPPRRRSVGMSWVVAMTSDHIGLSSRFSTRWQKETAEGFEDLVQVYDDLVFTARLTANPTDDWLSLNQTASYDLQSGSMRRWDATLKLRPFVFSMVASENTWLRYVYDGGTSSYVQQAIGATAFQPESYTVGLQLQPKFEPLWYNRILFALDMSLTYTQNLVDVKNTGLNFGVTASAKLSEFLDVSLAVKSENRRMFRYFGDYAQRLGISEVNIFEDLIDSFNIFDPVKRQKSMFKLASVEFKAIHYLADWQFEIGYTGNPKEVLENSRRLYIWDSAVNFSLSWKPLPLLKNSAKFKDNQFSIE